MKEKTAFDKTKKALINKFEASNWERITINMKNSGHKITIIPESQLYIKPENLSQIEWFLVQGSPTHIGGPSLDVLVNDLLRYDRLLIDLENDKKELKAFFDKNLAEEKNNPDFKTYESEAFGIYSDWHKDLFGFRPRGLVFAESMVA